jgi:hypothetical protein
MVRHTTLIKTHLLGVACKGDRVLAFALPFSVLDGHWTKSKRYVDWAHATYNICNGPVVSLSGEQSVPSAILSEINDTSSGANGNSTDGLRILSMHAYTPTWNPGAPMELFIVGYTIMGSEDPEKFYSYRVQLEFPTNYSSGHNEEVKLTARDVISVPVPYWPWDDNCILNSGQIVCVRSSMSCFELFSNAKQPVCELNIPNHPWDTNSTTAIVSSVDPWSGRIACASAGRLSTYHIA